MPTTWMDTVLRQTGKTSSDTPASPDSRGQRAKPVPLRISGSVALVAKPAGASHTAGTALSTCMPVAMLPA